MNKRLWLLFASISALTGCHSASDPTNENFSVAIQKYLDSMDGACVALPAQTVPFSLSKYDSGLPGSVLVRGRGLVNAGLLGIAPAITRGGGNTGADTLVFSLTEDGKKYLTKGPGLFPQFCGGKRKLHGIQSAQVVKSPTGTRALVSYAYDLVDQPSWMKNQTLQIQHPDLHPQGSINDQIVLTQTNDAWIP